VANGALLKLEQNQQAGSEQILIMLPNIQKFQKERICEKIRWINARTTSQKSNKSGCMKMIVR
jgi:Tfp pilus assembly protein PilZ